MIGSFAGNVIKSWQIDRVFLSKRVPRCELFIVLLQAKGACCLFLGPMIASFSDVIFNQFAAEGNAISGY